MFRKIYLLPLLFAAGLAGACGVTPKSVVTGDKYLALNIHNQDKKSDSVVIDDDGVLAAGLVAAYCNQNFDNLAYEAPKDKIGCLNDAQEGLDADGRVSTPYYGDGSTGALEAIKTKCGLDVKKEFDALTIKQNQTPLPCAAPAAGIVRRAAARYAAYTKDVQAMKLDASQGFTDAVRSRVQNTNAIMQSMTKLFEKPNPTVGDLKNWLPLFATLYKHESFTQAKDLEAIPKSNERPHLDQLLIDFGALLPELPRSGCGDKLPDNLLSILSAGDWHKNVKKNDGEDPDAIH